jgi:putative aldouronate transport system permease protein
MATVQPALAARRAGPRPNLAQRRAAFWRVVVKDWRRNKYIYLMLLPVVGYYLIFHYGPMYGVLIAFQDYNLAKGIWASPWIGLENFQRFFSSFNFARTVVNTLAINFLDLLFGFPAPIILALLLNEIHFNPFKKLVQTVTYMPHFISTVVVVGILFDFLARDGVINNLLASVLGIAPAAYLQLPDWFRPLFVGSGIWQHIGWGSIIYLAAISGIDPEQYDAAMVDGASRLQQMRHITLPGIMATVVILLILRIGNMMTVGYEKILLMYNPVTYETADVISTYIYRQGVLQGDYSFSAAVGLFNSCINFALLVFANWFSRRVGETSLW